MKTPFFRKADQWITKNLVVLASITIKLPRQKKINWISSVAVTSMILCVTLTYHFVFPQLKLLIYYGLILTLIYLQGVIYPIIFHPSGVWRTFIDQSVAVVVTFIFILLLGGIPYSGGLIYVGLAQVLFSLNFRERRATIWIFIIYIITLHTCRYFASGLVCSSRNDSGSQRFSLCSKSPLDFRFCTDFCSEFHITDVSSLSNMRQHA